MVTVIYSLKAINIKVYVHVSIQCIHLCKNVPHPLYVILYREYIQSETLRIRRMPCSEYIRNVPSDYFDNPVCMICSCRQGTSLDYKSLHCWEMRVCALYMYMYYLSLGQCLINLDAIFTTYAEFTCLSRRYTYTRMYRLFYVSCTRTNLHGK